MAKWLSKTDHTLSTQRNVHANKNTVPTPFVLVSVFALMLGLISFYKFPCPTCDGTGILASSQGLKATVAASNLIESYIPLTCCDHPQVQYAYDVTLLIENDGTNTINGTVTVSFYDIEPALSSSKDVNTAAEGVFPIQVEVPGGKTVTVNQQLSFISISDILGQPHTVTVQSGNVETKNICPLCNGTGKLPFYSWLEAHVK
jgi:hypothetical protein